MNKGFNLLYILGIIFFLFIISWYMPFSYKIYDSSIFLKLDLFLVFLFIQSFIIKRFKLILLGFLIGFLNDMDLESNLVGINSFLIPILCYFLSFLKFNSSNWDINIKLAYSSIIIIVYSLSKFFFYGWSIGFFDIISIIINSIIVLVVVFSIDRYYYKGRLIH